MRGNTRDNIKVDVADRWIGERVNGKTAVVTDRTSGRAWSGEGADASSATTEAVRKFLGDRRAREYME